MKTSKSMWVLALVLACAVSLGEARPKVFPWEKHATRGAARNKNHHKQQDPKIFFQDLEYFNQDDFGKDLDYNDFSDTSDKSDSYYDYSGYDSDDEDFSHQNTINTLPQKKGPSSWQQDPHAYLPEEYFGNELHDIDKLDELRRRMEQMQKEMAEMQNLLRSRSYNKQS